MLIVRFRVGLPESMRRNLAALIVAVFVGSGAAAVADDLVWQLRLQNGRPTDCWLGFTRAGQGAGNQPFLAADTRSAKGDWNACIVLPKGLLKVNQDYVVSLDYEVVDRSPDAHFYVLARSNRLGYGADKSQRWSGEPGARGTIKLRLTAAADDFIISAGIFKQGAIQIRNLKVVHGSGWASLPVQRDAGDQPAPATPPETLSFTVAPPANPTGPVLNLADFRAVADGDSPPSTDPDKNHAALVAAIAKCHEVKASKLIVPKGVYRITSGDSIIFDGLTDFTFDGGGSTFLYLQIKGGAAGVVIRNCTRTVFTHFNLDWDWNVSPLASVGRVTKVDPAFFEMRFETAAPLDPSRWITMNPLDEKLRAPGTGQEVGIPKVNRIESLDTQTVRVWPSQPVTPKVGQLYLLRHYLFDKHAFVLASNTFLSLQDVAIFSFPGNGFQTGGDQHHVELVNCRITYPPNAHRSITLTGGGFMLDQSHGFIKLENCDFGYSGDDCVDIHDADIHAGVRRLDDHTLAAVNLVPWTCPFAASDAVEIRNADFSPSGFIGTLERATEDYKNRQTILVFEEQLPSRIPSDAILFNRRYSTPNCIIRNCYFHENRARGVLCNSGGCLIEGNRFYHNQHAAIHLTADMETAWGEGFGARNVIVRNNTIESPNSCGAYNGAAVLVAAGVYGSATHYPLLQNLLLENNRFQETTGPMILAMSFQNLVIRNNTVINQGKAPIVLTMRGGICAELGNGLWAEGNIWTTEKNLVPPSLFYDPDTTQKVVCRVNQLKN